MKKFLIIGVAVVVALMAVTGYMFAWWMQQPLYRPGMVRAGENLRASLNAPPQTADSRYWQVEPDIRLYFEVQGQGQPVLIVHGGPGFPSANWEGLQPLSEQFAFYYYHQRGCGNSTKPFDRFESKNFYANMTDLERTLGIGAQLADIERIRRILGQEQLILIGHSFGGFLAALYAAEFPEHVRALVLVAPAGVLQLPDDNGDLFARLRAELPADEHAEYDRFREEELFDFGSVFSRSEAELAAMHRRGGNYLLRALGESLGEHQDTQHAIPNGGWMAHALYFSMGARHDYRSALSAVTAPVLIVHGQDDQLLLDGSRTYVASLPDATLHVVDGGSGRAGHFLFNDQPQKFAAIVGDFLLQSK